MALLANQVKADLAAMCLRSMLPKQPLEPYRSCLKVRSVGYSALLSVAAASRVC